MIADKNNFDMEKAWAVIEIEIKNDLGLALNWLSKLPKLGQ